MIVLCWFIFFLTVFWSFRRRTAACRCHNSIILTNLMFSWRKHYHHCFAVLPARVDVHKQINALKFPFFCGGVNSTNVAFMEMQNICCYLSDFLLDIKTIWGHDVSDEGIILKMPPPPTKKPHPRTQIKANKLIKKTQPKTRKVHFNNCLLRTGFVGLFQNDFVIPNRNVSASWLREKKRRSRKISCITINWANVPLPNSQSLQCENVTSAARDEILRTWSDI